MKINKLNYENFVIDYIEGTLSVELKKDFDLFLEKNEEVYEEIKDYISAPVFEESKEIFVDKKSIKKTEKFNPYFFLAIIPILCLGAYFLIPNKTESTTPNKQVELEEFVPQFAEKTTIKPMQELATEIQAKTKKESTPLPTIKNSVAKKQKAQKENISKQVYYASNNVTKEQVKINTPTKIINEVIAQPLLQSIASVDALPLNVFESKNNIAFLDAPFAINNPKISNKKEQLLGKNKWLEMVTPASFKDLDLKESLAIESNVNLNTSRKILNAFIPTSLVK